MHAETRARLLSRFRSQLNLIRSEDEERDVTPIRHPACRANLYYAPTTLTDETGTPLHQLGLFTSARLNVGEFLCLYNGEWYDVDAYEALPNQQRLNEYAIQTEDSEGGLVVVPPLSGVRPNPDLYPASMANEPQAQRESNAYLVEYKFLLDELDVDPATVDEERVDDEFVGVGLVACRTIGAHREIFWSYGDGFPRRYRAGRQCAAPERMQDPREVLGRIPRDCVSLDVTD